MLDKTRKIIYIITGTLTIISLVFMLMHKVGLCASGGSSGSDSQVYVDSIAPIPYGNHLGYASDVTFNVEFYDRIRTLFLTEFPNSSNIFCSIYEEEEGDYIEFVVFNLKNSKTGDNYTWNDSDSYKKFYFAKNSYDGRYITYHIQTDTFTMGNSSPNDYNVNVTSLISKNPAYPTSGLEWVVTKGVYKYRYPVFYYSGGEYTTLNSNYGNYSGGMVFPLVESGSDDTDFNVDDFTFPDYSDIGSSPSSSDSDYNLFQWLNGQNSNQYDYSKSIFDLLKGFISWVTSPNIEGYLFCSQERQQELLEGSQVYQDVQALQGIGNSIFGVLGATASDHVYWTFDFSGTVLDNCGLVQIDFDWYDSIRNYVVPLFLAFFYVGMLLLIIRKIPGIISGASSNSDDK